MNRNMRSEVYPAPHESAPSDKLETSLGHVSFFPKPVWLRTTRDTTELKTAETRYPQITPSEMKLPWAIIPAMHPNRQVAVKIFGLLKPQAQAPAQPPAQAQDRAQLFRLVTLTHETRQILMVLRKWVNTIWKMNVCRTMYFLFLWFTHETIWVCINGCM